VSIHRGGKISECSDKYDVTTVFSSQDAELILLCNDQERITPDIDKEEG